MNLKEWNELVGREQFVVKESNLEEFSPEPSRPGFGAILLCTSGRARLIINLEEQEIFPGSEVNLIIGSSIALLERSEDFSAYCFYFSEEMARDVTYHIDPIFFKHLTTHPFFHHDEISYPNVLNWMQMANYTYLDRENRFRTLITRNRLHNFFLEICDKVLRGRGNPSDHASPHRNEIYHRFMDLAHKLCTRNRNVAYYADKLCISTRYLSSITREIRNRSAKELIDDVLVQEIKIRLRTTQKTIQEISNELNFPDQSYLGRYFKRHTGISPTQFRNSNEIG